MHRKTLTARTASGSQLPILDITAPAFSLPTPGQLATMEIQYLEESGRQTELAEPLLQALRSSVLGNALLASAGSYLAGMPTYLLKLRPEDLGPDASFIDRRIVASFPAVCARFRLADICRLTASELLRTAAAHPNRPICLVNVGGGTAVDSWNSLILARRESPALLEDRPIAVAVFDPDTEGPAFAVNAFHRLSEPDAPLDGLNLHVHHWPVTWSELGQLRETLASMRVQDAICAVSSEGALFEYGSDEEITGVLRAIHNATAETAFVVGSVTREGPCAKAAQRASRAATRPQSMEAFSQLASSAGWRVDHTITRPLSYQVQLAKDKT